MSRMEGAISLLELLLEANSCRHRRDYRAALELYLQAAGSGAGGVDLLAEIANCYFQAALSDPHETGADYVEAVAWARRALEQAPGEWHLRAQLAEYYALGTLEYEGAAREYHLALAADGCSAAVYAAAASLYGVPECVVSLDEAVTWLQRATQLEPDDPDYHARLGQLLQEAGRLAEARQEWLRALLCPRALDPRYEKTIRSRWAKQAPGHRA